MNNMKRRRNKYSISTPVIVLNGLLIIIAIVTVTQIEKQHQDPALYQLAQSESTLINTGPIEQWSGRHVEWFPDDSGVIVRTTITHYVPGEEPNIMTFDGELTNEEIDEIIADATPVLEGVAATTTGPDPRIGVLFNDDGTISQVKDRTTEVKTIADRNEPGDSQKVEVQDDGSMTTDSAVVRGFLIEKKELADGSLQTVITYHDRYKGEQVIVVDYDMFDQTIKQLQPTHTVVTQATPVTQSLNNNLFRRDLTLEYTGDDVVRLQNFLEERRFLVMPEGVSKGYFGELTRAALADFQRAAELKPSEGYFGPKTRAYLNARRTESIR